jgi:hypothetical protein
MLAISTPPSNVQVAVFASHARDSETSTHRSSEQRGRLYRAGSVQITLDRYGHLLPQSCDSAGDRLEVALFVTAFAKRLQAQHLKTGSALFRLPATTR